MTTITAEQIHSIGEVLNNKDRPLKERFRALFTLKNLGGMESVKEISRCFEDDSALLKHELAYCLGQMQDPSAVGVLTKVLEDEKQEPMVRHEAAEALGAIGVPEVTETLQKYENDPCVEVAETCKIALDRVKWLKDGNVVEDKNPYNSVDPSPPAKEQESVEDLKKIFLNRAETLFDRYRAMFSLRNLRTRESALALVEGLKDESALFRHEVAFVLGQLQDACTVPYLRGNLEDANENEMVRHECAEALGAIANQECLKILNYYRNDKKRVVKESCVIALDMCEYENSPEFQYANGLVDSQK